jgi:hypothetical protein
MREPGNRARLAKPSTSACRIDGTNVLRVDMKGVITRVAGKR